MGLIDYYGYWFASQGYADTLVVAEVLGTYQQIEYNKGPTSGPSAIRPVVCLYEGVSATWDATNNVYRLSK